jgi:hypothetical protein
MRKLLALTVLLGAGSLAVGQYELPIPDRYGVAANTEAYPQAAPKDALGSAVRVLEKGRYEYFVAHLLDPAFVDARVADRARYLEGQVERELRARRETQRGAPAGVVRVPNDPAGLAAAVRAEARQRAFGLVAQDIRALLTENPDHLRDLQRFLRSADFTVTGEQAKASLKDVKDREVFFRKDGTRWFVLDRKQEPPVAAAK